jgi:glycosyltransferase involved in cell wall biosynthesis
VRVLIDYRPALRQRTGVGEYTHHLAAALVSRLGPRDGVVLFSSSWKDRLPADTPPGATLVDRRVPVRLLNFAWHRVGWPPVELLAGPVDVAHALHPLLIPTRRAARVVTIHDLYFLEAQEHTEAEIRRDYAALARSHAPRADAVVVNSHDTARQVASRFGVPPDRITVCYPGAPAWAARPAPAPAGPILFIGTIQPRKNVRVLVDAYARLVARRPTAPELVLAGQAGQGSSQVLDGLAAPPVAGRAHYLGYVSDAEREALYRKASMVVVPSLHEGFGMTALEAMTVGVPVIVANRGALPEVVGEAGLIVDPQDPDALAGAIERLLTDQALSTRCAQLGIERSRRFTWNAGAEALLDAYARAVERRGIRPS